MYFLLCNWFLGSAGSSSQSGQKSRGGWALPSTERSQLSGHKKPDGRMKANNAGRKGSWVRSHTGNMLLLSKTQNKRILFPDVGSVKVGRFYAVLFCYIDVESTSYSLLLGEKACWSNLAVVVSLLWWSPLDPFGVAGCSFAELSRWFCVDVAGANLDIEVYKNDIYFQNGWILNVLIWHEFLLDTMFC